jgi:predicted RNase H-like HicB family nuclease
MPDNDMGNPKNITNKTFEEAAKAAGQTPQEAKENALELLQKTLGEKEKAKEQKG